jgi:hypothetical protein
MAELERLKRAFCGDELGRLLYHRIRDIWLRRPGLFSTGWMITVEIVEQRPGAFDRRHQVNAIPPRTSIQRRALARP